MNQTDPYMQAVIEQGHWDSWIEFRGGQWLWLNPNERWVYLPKDIRRIQVVSAPLGPTYQANGFICRTISGKLRVVARFVFPAQEEHFLRQFKAYVIGPSSSPSDSTML